MRWVLVCSSWLGVAVVTAASMHTRMPSDAARECASCHAGAVASFTRHGMSRSLGPAGRTPTGVVTNAASGNRYEFRAPDARGPALLVATFADGGRRQQQIVGRIGAGIVSTSWVTEELEPVSGEPTGRLFFAPVESVAGKGLSLAPFEHHARSPGIDQELTVGCLTCHTASVVGPAPFPANRFGSDAFSRLSALTCEACHGDTREHVRAMREAGPEGAPDPAMRRLRDLPAPAQRDICARCHLQGDARFELGTGDGDRVDPVAGRIPVVVPQTPTSDFRFVGQLERLVLSACFQKSPAMTCSTCHWPHTGVAEQGTEAFDAACVSCHSPRAGHTRLTVRDVTGEPPRTEGGCVDCHVRRSAPFDLPYARTADHFVRRRIERPSSIDHRQFADQRGALVVFDDGRLAPALRTTAGRQWESGVLAMALLTMGRLAEAAAQFDTLPAPGTSAARDAGSALGLAAVGRSSTFHTMRALALMATGRLDGALAALDDALAIDPKAADALLTRAQLRFDRGDLRGALLDTESAIKAYPAAEQPWNLRVAIAERAGRPDLAVSAARASLRLWPSNARNWTTLARLLRQAGDRAGAEEALGRARVLAPSLVPAPAKR